MAHRFGVYNSFISAQDGFWAELNRHFGLRGAKGTLFNLDGQSVKFGGERLPDVIQVIQGPGKKGTCRQTLTFTPSYKAMTEGQTWPKLYCALGEPIGPWKKCALVIPDCDSPDNAIVWTSFQRLQSDRHMKERRAVEISYSEPRGLQGILTIRDFGLGMNTKTVQHLATLMETSQDFTGETRAFCCQCASVCRTARDPNRLFVGPEIRE